eukprot:tig00000605_g2505.t1
MPPGPTQATPDPGGGRDSVQHGWGVNDAILDAIDAAARDTGQATAWARAPKPPRRVLPQFQRQRSGRGERAAQQPVPPLPLGQLEESLPPVVGAAAAGQQRERNPSPPAAGSGRAATSASPRPLGRRGSGVPSTVPELEEPGPAATAAPPPAAARPPAASGSHSPRTRPAPAPRRHRPGPPGYGSYREFTPGYGSRLHSRGADSAPQSARAWTAGAPPAAASRAVDPPALWGFEAAPARPAASSARYERVVYVTVPSAAAVPPGTAPSDVVELGAPPREAAGSDAIFMSTLLGPANPSQLPHAAPAPDVGPSRVPPQFHVYEASPLPITGRGMRESKSFGDSRVYERLVFPTARPTGREEVLHLANALQRMLLAVAASSPRRRPPDAEGDEEPVWARYPDPEELFGPELRCWDVAFHELVRQVRCHCWERGELLERIRSRHGAIFREAFEAARAARRELEAEEAALQAATGRLAAASALNAGAVSGRGPGSTLRRALAEMEESNARASSELDSIRQERSTLAARLARAEQENMAMARNLSLARRKRIPEDQLRAELEEAIRQRLLLEATGSARWDPEVVGRKAEEESLFRLYKDAYDKMEEMRKAQGALLEDEDSRREAAIRFLLTWQNARQFRPQLSAYWALFFWTGLCRRRAILVSLLFEQREARRPQPHVRFVMTQTDAPYPPPSEALPAAPTPATPLPEGERVSQLVQTDPVLIKTHVTREARGVQCHLNPDGTEVLPGQPSAEEAAAAAAATAAAAAAAEAEAEAQQPPKAPTPPPEPEEAEEAAPKKGLIKKARPKVSAAVLSLLKASPSSQMANRKVAAPPPKPKPQPAPAAPAPPPQAAGATPDMPLKPSERINYNHAMAELERLRGENAGLREAAAAAARRALDAALGEARPCAPRRGGPGRRGQPRGAPPQGHRDRRRGAAEGERGRFRERGSEPGAGSPARSPRDGKQKEEKAGAGGSASPGRRSPRVEDEEGEGEEDGEVPEQPEPADWCVGFLRPGSRAEGPGRFMNARQAGAPPRRPPPPPHSSQTGAAIAELGRRMRAMQAGARELIEENEELRKAVEAMQAELKDKPRMRKLAEMAMRQRRPLSIDNFASLASGDPYRDPSSDFKRNAGGKAWKPGGGAVAWKKDKKGAPAEGEEESEEEEEEEAAPGRPAGGEDASAAAKTRWARAARPKTAGGGPKWPGAASVLGPAPVWYLEGIDPNVDPPANELGLRLAMVSGYPQDEERKPLPPSALLRVVRDFLRSRDLADAATAARDPFHPLLYLPLREGRPDWSLNPVPRVRDLLALFYMDKYGSRHLCAVHGYRLVASMGLERAASPWVEALARVLEGGYSFDVFRCMYAGLVAMGRGAGAAGVGTALASDGQFARPWLDPELARAVAGAALQGHAPGIVDWALARAADLYREACEAAERPADPASPPRSALSLPAPPLAASLAPRSFAGMTSNSPRPPADAAGNPVAAPLLLLAICEAYAAVEHAFVRWVVHIFDEACGGRPTVSRNALERLFRGSLSRSPVAEAEGGWTPLVAELWAAAAADGTAPAAESLGLAAFGRAAARSPLMRAVFRAACAAAAEAAAAAACVSPLDAWRAVLRVRGGGRAPEADPP